MHTQMPISRARLVGTLMFSNMFSNADIRKNYVFLCIQLHFFERIPRGAYDSIYVHIIMHIHICVLHIFALICLPDFPARGITQWLPVRSWTSAFIVARELLPCVTVARYCIIQYWWGLNVNKTTCSSEILWSIDVHYLAIQRGWYYVTSSCVKYLGSNVFSKTWFDLHLPTKCFRKNRV